MPKVGPVKKLELGQCVIHDGEFQVSYTDGRGRGNRKRPLQDAAQYYAYVWRFLDIVIYVGQGHNNRGRPQKSDVSGRPADLVKFLKTHWKYIDVEIFPCSSQVEARTLEVKLTLSLFPKYNTVVGFAGFTGRKHSAEAIAVISESSTGRPASELCKQKARERMIERNLNNPPRKGKKCSEEHKRKLREARLRYLNKKATGEI